MARAELFILGLLGVGGLAAIAARAKNKVVVPEGPNDDPAEGLPVDPYAPLETQSQCIMTRQPGMLAFRAWVLSQYGEAPGAIENILRDCSIGGNSEHKEGRAWDWFPRSKTDGDMLMAELVAGDNELARRAGIMYMIWQGKIWRSYPHSGNAPGQWGPYSGPNPHTDHVHFSLGWPGALGETTLYTHLIA